MADFAKEEKASFPTEGDDKKPPDGSSMGRSTTERVCGIFECVLCIISCRIL